ncbi:hypothetical protein HAX54_031113 [Datura stramonium]|uniref:Uncharacterized protein n=1 Tax=Datura stramonium TaxID=4076 RepID=A0ABS8VB17_DATST|nr:hypothetical protein [Datura stramonium]
MVFPSSVVGMNELWNKIDVQKWSGLFSNREAVCTKSEVIEFFKHFSSSRGCITSRVGSILVVFDSHYLGSLLGIPRARFASCRKNKWPDLTHIMPMEIVHKFSSNPSRTSAAKVLKNVMSDYHKLLFSFVMHVRKNHALPYDFLLTKVFSKLGVKFTSLEYLSNYDMLDHFETRESYQDVGVRGSSSNPNAATSQVLLDNKCLTEKKANMRLEIADLRAQLARNEELDYAHDNDVITLLKSLSPLPPPSAASESGPSAPAP